MSVASHRIYDVRAGWLTERPLIGRLAVPLNTRTRSGLLKNSAQNGISSASEMRFQYDAAWVDRGFSMGTDLPLTRGVLTPRPGKTTFAVLEDRAIGQSILPLFSDSTHPSPYWSDEIGRQANAAVTLPHPTDALGALAIHSADDTPATDRFRVRRTSELPDLIYAFHAWERAKADAADLTLLQRASTLPGQRLVFTVERDRVPQTVRLRSMNDPIDRPLWLHLSLLAAQRCGIRTVKSTLEREMGENVLFTTRADRTPQGAPLMTLSAAVLAERHPGVRPFAPGYLAIADILNREGATPSDDLPQVWRRMVFMAMTGGSGDMLHRWLFVRHPLGWRLAPAHSLEWFPNGGRPGLTIDGRRRLTMPDDALPLAPYFGLTVTDAKAILMDMRRTLSAWEDMALEIGADPRDLALMAPIFDENL